MDYFMDKLVERINAQNAVRNQNIRPASENRVQYEEPAAPKHKAPAPAPAPAVAPASAPVQTAVIDEAALESVVTSVTEAIKHSDERNAELINEMNQVNQSSRLSATEEMMAAQASAREAIIEAIDAAVADIKSATYAPVTDDYDVENAIATSAADIKGVVVTKSSDVKNAIDATAVSLKNDIDNYAFELKEAIRALAMELASDNDEGPQEEDILVSLKEVLAANQAELSEHVHKEVVKCYKNTQAAMDESLEKQAENLNGITKKVNPVIKKMLIAALVLLGLNFVGMVTILLWIFRII